MTGTRTLHDPCDRHNTCSENYGDFSATSEDCRPLRRDIDPRAYSNPALDGEHRSLGSAAGFWEDFHTGADPAGITTQDPDLARRLDPVLAGRRLANYLQVLTLEAQTLARACGKSHVLNLEPEDLAALTVEAAAMANVPLAGTNWIPGRRER